VGRWNFGTKKHMTLLRWSKLWNWGNDFMWAQRFLCHWHTIFYDTLSILSCVPHKIEKNK
jgi:hypothetical protein